MALTHAERLAAESSFSPTDTISSVSGSLRSRERRDRAAALVAGLRAAKPDLDDLARREQREIVGAGRKLGPAEAAIGRVQLAHREVGALGRRANLLERLVDEQRLVAGDEVDLGETVGQVPVELPQR